MCASSLGDGTGSATTANRAADGCILYLGDKRDGRWPILVFRGLDVTSSQETTTIVRTRIKNGFVFVGFVFFQLALCTLVQTRFVSNYLPFGFCSLVHPMHDHSHLLKSACLFCLSQSPNRYGFFCLLFLVCFSCLFFSSDGGSPVVALLGAFVVVL